MQDSRHPGNTAADFAAAPQAETPYALELDDITVGYESGQRVLAGFSLSVPTGQTKAIVGPSGAGKSTLLRLALGLVRPRSGSVRVFAEDITHLSDRAMKDIRHRIGMVFQGGALFDSLTVAENVGFCPVERHGIPRRMAERLVRRRLKYVGLEDAFHKMPSQLSGGMVKRIAIARAVICDPELLLYDEPTTGLDPSSSQKVIRIINQLRDDSAVTSVVVTHDLDVVRAIADTVALVAGGRILFDGTPEALFNSTDTQVQGFLLAEEA